MHQNSIILVCGFFISNHFLLLCILSGFKLQHTFESLQNKRHRAALQESDITDNAIIKLLKITAFLMKNHWAHSTNYEDFVRFVGNSLEEEILHEYLKYAESHKNATYLSQKTVTQFIQVISKWMLDEILSEVKDCEHFSILMDESTDEANRSELSAFCRLVKDGVIKNHFMELIPLSRCDAQSIYASVTKFLE